MQKAYQWEIASEAAWGVALLREAVIRPLAEHSRLSAESVAKAADQLGLSRTILYKLLQRYRRRPQTSSLLPWKRGRKPAESLLGEEREALLNTRMIAGFHVSLWSPSALSVCLALTHAVLEKTSWLADRELQTLEWPISGLPQVLHLDNAREFHSEALVRGCQEYGIRLDHRPVGRPHFGGHIERLIGTMMGAVHLLPGTTFSDVKQKGC